MSPTTLATLAAHVDEHGLPWTIVSEPDYQGRLRVQVGSESGAVELARWAATLDHLDWTMHYVAGDDTNTSAAWYVHAIGELDGLVDVWCALPAADLGGTPDVVVEHMRRLTSHASAQVRPRQAQ